MSRRRVERLRRELEAVAEVAVQLSDALEFAMRCGHKDALAMQRAKRVIAALVHELPDETVQRVMDACQAAERCGDCGHAPPSVLVRCKACGHVQPRGADACAKCGGFSLLWARRRTDVPQA